MTYSSRYFLEKYFPAYFLTVLKTQPEEEEQPFYGGRYINNHVPPVYVPEEEPFPFNDDDEVLQLFALILSEVTRCTL